MNRETLRKAYELRSLESRAVTAVAPVLPTLPLCAARADAVAAKIAWITHNITGMHNRAPGVVCAPAAGRGQRPKAASSDLTILTSVGSNCGGMLNSNGRRRKPDGEANQPHARGPTEGTAG